MKTDIKLTTQQREWLQKNIIKSRRLSLKYRNESHMAFRKAVSSGNGNFFLALGANGAIYGGLSFATIID